MSHHATVHSAQDAGGLRSGGTPKTISEAIERGLDEMFGGPAATSSDVEAIRRHIKDFLSQRIGAVMLTDRSDTTTKLWNSIFPEDPRSSSS